MNGPELAEAVGVTYRQIDYWTRKGHLRSTVPDPGNGHPRDYPASEIRVARALALLVAAGVRLEVAAVVARGDAMAIARLSAALTESLRSAMEAA